LFEFYFSIWYSIAPTILPIVVSDVFISSKTPLNVEKFHSFGSSSTLSSSKVYFFDLISKFEVDLCKSILEVGLESGLPASFPALGLPFDNAAC